MTVRAYEFLNASTFGPVNNGTRPNTSVSGSSNPEVNLVLMIAEDRRSNLLNEIAFLEQVRPNIVLCQVLKHL